MNRKLSVMMVVLSATAPSLAWAASFDCGKTSTQVEHMVCATPALSRADEQLAAAFKTSRETFDDTSDGAASVVADLIASQRSWLQQRNACTDIACLQQAYAVRAATLGFHARAGHDAAADKWAGTYSYKGFLKLSVQVRDDDTVRVAIDGAEPGTAKWTCSFAGIAQVTADSMQVSTPSTLTGHLGAGGIEINDTPANQATSQSSCGLNGSLIWLYGPAPVLH